MTAVSRFVPAGWRRAFAVAGVCLPVPLAAVTGLSLPLPAAVERLAAAFVPWVETAGLQANEALSRGAPGSIGVVIDEVAETVVDAAQPEAVSEAVATRRPALPARSGGGVALPPLVEPAAEPSEEPSRREGEPAPQPSPTPAAETPAPQPAANEPASAPEPTAPPPAPAPTPAPNQPAPPPPVTKEPEPTAPVVEVVQETVDAGGKVVDDVTTVVENTTGVQVPAVPPLPGLGK